MDSPTKEATELPPIILRQYFSVALETEINIPWIRRDIQSTESLAAVTGKTWTHTIPPTDF